jgi:PX domain
VDFTEIVNLAKCIFREENAIGVFVAAMTRAEMYLAQEDWSPRFEHTFFTVCMEGYEFLKSPPAATDTNPLIGGKTSMPAYYYKVKVFCGHESHTVLRRYSHFEWLYKQLPRDVTMSDEPLLFPPGSWCQPQNDQFAQHRLEQLRDFLRDALPRPGVAKLEAVANFLELDSFLAS